MTPQEALENLKNILDYEVDYNPYKLALNMAINVLEKQIPKEPLKLKNDKDLKIGASIWRAGVPVYKCPHCESFISYSSKYCSECGQAIDRSK